MSVLIHDAVSLLSPSAKAAYDRGNLADLVYADDTMLLGISAEHLSEYLRAVKLVGERYGMELHTGKFQMISVQGSPASLFVEAEEIPVKTSMEYLGTVLHSDGSNSHELGRRIGAARKVFE